ncbi:helix-turn-helix domain-containing protein [Pseudomonas sp. NPDC007930]|uniref:helix-turn-helix domain-containing protein n=1 Tax=Pseudomonas sp. NPDC007930 TaxID=3364417 RepID=UPI0036F16084
MPMIYNPLALGSRLEALRKKRKLSQDDLASQVDCSRRTIMNLEAGANVSSHTLFRVLEVLGLALDLGDRRVDMRALKALREHGE